MTLIVPAAANAIDERMEPRSEQWQKMLAGELYDPMAPDMVTARAKSQRLCREYNNVDFGDMERREWVLRELLGSMGEKCDIVAPFYCDYGVHIRMGSGVFMNFGCVILDCSWITIGDRVLMGPGVQIYGASHPLQASVRGKGLEFGRPVVIGDDIWIGGGAIICPGVTIGSGSTIGAGSVVTRDIPANVFAAGNPCRVIREIPESAE